MNDDSIVIKTRNDKLAIIPYVVVMEAPIDGDTTNPPPWTIQALPVKLAWALTTHKAQGMTLDAVEIDLGSSVFEYGQAYTALSRAKTLESVKVIAVHPKAFKCHPHVIEYMQLLH
jgi:hypothetical protein